MTKNDPSETPLNLHKNNPSVQYSSRVEKWKDALPAQHVITAVKLAPTYKHFAKTSI